jgi:hypothetical protein
MRVMNIYKGIQDKGLHAGTPTIFIDLVGSHRVFPKTDLEQYDFDDVGDIDFDLCKTSFPHHLASQTCFHLAQPMDSHQVASDIIELLPDGNWELGKSKIHLCFNLIDCKFNQDEIVLLLQNLRRHSNLNSTIDLECLIFNVYGNVYFEDKALEVFKRWASSKSGFNTKRNVLFQIFTFESLKDNWPEAESLQHFIRKVVSLDLRISFLNEIETDEGFTSLADFRNTVDQTLQSLEDEKPGLDYVIEDRLRYVLTVAKFYVFTTSENDYSFLAKCFEHGVCYHPVPFNSRGQYGKI